jgi:hypothetical protein
VEDPSQAPWSVVPIVPIPALRPQFDALSLTVFLVDQMGGVDYRGAWSARG